MDRRVLRFLFSFCLLLLGEALLNHTAEAQVRRAPVHRPRLQEPRRTRLPEVTKVSEISREQVLAAARRVDELVDANLKKHNITPNPLTTDEQFVRRIYLDLTGTIPTLPQTRSFLNSKDPEKRTKLIDDLLNSYGYVSHHYNYWGGILRLQDSPSSDVVGLPYLQWVKKSLQHNTPYDVWVREMLTAQGTVWENPAAGYFLRDEGMPLNHVTSTLRIFLATQIDCAQCHDHPYDRWTQRDFYQLAAWLYPTQTRLGDKGEPLIGQPSMESMTKLRGEISSATDDTRTAGTADQILKYNLMSVHDQPGLEMRYPAEDGQDGGEVVLPTVLFDPQPVNSPGASRREIFAAWVTSPENPRFAKTIANRLWKKAMGVGQFEPIDDLKDDTVAENPELMEHLTETMILLKFDMKEYLRVLYNSKSYQRQVSTADLPANETYHFPGPLLRRMTAEQAWDSFLTLALDDPNHFRAPSTLEAQKMLEVDLRSINGEQLIKMAEHLSHYNSPEEVYKRRMNDMYQGDLMARASELPLPAPPGHFLHQFGQGDRDFIEGTSAEGSIPQVLSMFNGPITHMMLEGGSAMYNNVSRAKSIEESIEILFLTILSRKPARQEYNLALEEIKSGGPAGYGNVIWALVNTREFLFIQ